MEKEKRLGDEREGDEERGKYVIIQSIRPLFRHTISSSLFKSSSQNKYTYCTWNKSILLEFLLLSRSVVISASNLRRNQLYSRLSHAQLITL